MLLCFLWLTCIVVEIAYLVAWLIAVPVMTCLEERIELCNKGLFASHQLHQSIDVVRHIPSVMTRLTLADEFLEAPWVRVEERAIIVSSVGPTCSRVDDIAVVLASVEKLLRYIVVSESLSKTGKDEIVVGIFESARGLFGFMISVGNRVLHRNIAISQI